MKIGFCIFTGLLLFLVDGSFAQQGPLGIEEKLNLYFKATESKQWDRVLDLINPKVFKWTPRTVIERMYVQMDRKASMLVNFEKMKVLDYRSEMIVSDTSYVPIDYSMTLQIQVNPGIYQTKKQLRKLHEGFQLGYLGQGIEFDEKNHRFILETRNTLLASSPIGQESWTFWEYRPNDPMTQLIFPSQVINRLERGWTGH